MELRYKKLDLENDKDKRIMNRILSFDTTKNCFGDYDFYEVAPEYINYAIYIKNKLIGYLGISYEDSIYYSEKNRYTITICIREEYQSMGLGSIILKQTIKTLFSDYDARSINIEVIESNDKCNNLISKNHFTKEKDDFFLKDGKYVKSIHYAYTKEEYEKDKDILKIYKKIN